jgi:hypothetical protein
MFEIIDKEPNGTVIKVVGWAAPAATPSIT